MSETSNTQTILNNFLKKMENIYGQALRFDENGSKKYGYIVGVGGVVISVSEMDDSLTIQVFENMSLKDTNGYLTYHGSPQTLGGFAYKTPEEVQEIIDMLCDILLENQTPHVDAKIVKQKVMEAEFTCYQKHHQISAQTMKSMKLDAERAALN